MRILIAVIFLAIASTVSAPSTANAQYCQGVCSYDGYGRRHCRRVCERPRYVAPQPQYTPPYNYSYAPPYQYARPEFPAPALIALVVLAVIVAAVVAAFSGSTATTDLISESEDIRAGTATTRALTEHTRMRTRHLEDDFSAAVRQSHESGRAAADEAWESMMEKRRG